MPEVETDGYQHWSDGHFIAVRDSLVGETDADNFRHSIVRSAFFWAFWEDARVQALVRQFAKNTGLEDTAWRLASASDRLASKSSTQL